MWIQRLLLIALGGVLGSLARYGLADLVQSVAGRFFSAAPSFPWGTVAVNLLGCFAFGLVASALEDRAIWVPELRTLLLIGFMGAFTTFSTFVSETGQLLSQQQWLFALGNVALQNVVGLAALFAGLAAGRML